MTACAAGGGWRPAVLWVGADVASDPQNRRAAARLDRQSIHVFRMLPTISRGTPDRQCDFVGANSARRGSLGAWPRSSSTPSTSAATARVPSSSSPKGVAFREIDVSHDQKTRRWLAQVSGQSTVPQIFINGQSVGGCDDITELDHDGELDPPAGPAPRPARPSQSRP